MKESIKFQNSSNEHNKILLLIPRRSLQALSEDSDFLLLNSRTTKSLVFQTRTESRSSEASHAALVEERKHLAVFKCEKRWLASRQSRTR